MFRIVHPWRAMTLLVGVCALVVGPPSAHASTTLYPDLVMRQIVNIKIDTTTVPGHTLLRYSASMINLGAGALELRGSRPDTSQPDMTTVKQRIYDDGGGHVDTQVPGYMFYAGDGHNHWHYADIEGGTLSTLDGTPIGFLAKHGFCFSDSASWDPSLPGAPPAKVYHGCAANQPQALKVTMGLSVGWLDRYGANTNLQWIDITGLPPGKYRLTDTVNPNLSVIESCDTNDSSYAIIRINSDNTVNRLSASPTPSPGC